MALSIGEKMVLAIRIVDVTPQMMALSAAEVIASGVEYDTAPDFHQAVVEGLLTSLKTAKETFIDKDMAGDTSAEDTLNEIIRNNPKAKRD